MDWLSKKLVSRRGAMELGLVAATAAVSPPANATADRKAEPQIGDAFVSIADPRGALQADSILRGGAPVRCWPMDRKSGVVRDGALFNQTLLLRTAGVAKEDALDGLVAFTAICPHAGCVVSEWIPQTARLHCPCHGSEYDPAKKGNVVAGPSPLPLPSLPVGVVDGLVTVAGPFSAPPGGHTSRTT